ncbi:D-hexose-6-phosphate mutarotase [Microbulbifer sp.]|uniref:D-hexose-6-phosphate mutarotase n=1 Tax=Microbulbifer sp. TaxID=1908541 RepID=UPI00258F630D|nr:D-hexose-6-phosphate mutarotase [Microbulbifer sp.]
MTEQAFLSHTNSETLYGKPGLDLLVVETRLCKAVVALQGAQVLEFQARDRAPLLWVSPLATMEPGVAVRGGVPLCLPWFGEHADPTKPKHGLVRNQLWQLQESRQDDASGEVALQLQFEHPGDDLFPTPFICTLRVTLGESLGFELGLENRGDQPAAFSWALHSYFAVDDVSTVKVGGLDGIEYLDKTLDFARHRLSGEQTFSGEVDRVFESAPGSQVIDTEQPIRTRSDNCHTVITWNPGAELASTINDIGEHYRNFVCVEHGNAFANHWQLAAGESAKAALKLSR